MRYIQGLTVTCGVLVASLAILPPVAAQSTGAVSPLVAPAPLAYAETVRDARRLVHADLAEKGYPGLAIAVSVDGRTVWSEGFGLADLEHRLPMSPRIKFRVGSISKSMTAAAVATLVEAGQLDLDVPIQAYVPDFPEKGTPITARHLGGHLGGIRHYQGRENFIRDPYDTVLEAIEIFADDPLLHEPGSAYSYTSHGFNLLSAVVEGAAGTDFLTYMRAVVFGPLAMNDTVADHVTAIIPNRAGFYSRTDEGHLVNAPFVNNSYKWAGGGFLSTTEDVLRFANAHLDEDYLSADARALLFTEQTTRDGEGVGYGLGWFVRADDEGRRLLYHSGGSIGGTSLMIMRPDTRVVVVGLINLGRADNGVVREVLARFDAAVRAEPSPTLP